LLLKSANAIVAAEGYVAFEGPDIADLVRYVKDNPNLIIKIFQNWATRHGLTFAQHGVPFVFGLSNDH
jgi:hypothetical protein